MPRILLIDDDAQLGEPLAAYFRRFDLELHQATRPSEGLARLRERAAAAGDAIASARRIPTANRILSPRTVPPVQPKIAELP